jgi:stearoyl-CoA desaturase (delta-9 desaturase)
MGWFMSPRGFVTEHAAVPDLMKYPELRWLDRYDLVVPVALAAALFVAGKLLAAYAPELHTGGAQLLVWGFFVSTVVLFHCTVTINSLAHRWGTRRFATRDNSRNNWLLALITFGEGWHNNHHHFPGSARQGFRWWEYDVTYYVLRAMAALGLVWDLRPLPEALRNSRLQSAPAPATD